FALILQIWHDKGENIRKRLDASRACFDTAVETAVVGLVPDRDRVKIGDAGIANDPAGPMREGCDLRRRCRKRVTILDEAMTVASVACIGRAAPDRHDILPSRLCDIGIGLYVFRGQPVLPWCGLGTVPWEHRADIIAGFRHSCDCFDARYGIRDARE